MAEGSGDGPYKWPGPVTFNDDDPKKGHCTIFLSVQGLKVDKPLLGKATPKNATVKDEFTTSSVCITVTMSGEKPTEYQYKKSLPEDIEPEKSSYKLKKDQVILDLQKASKDSWAAHAKYMIRKE